MSLVVSSPLPILASTRVAMVQSLLLLFLVHRVPGSLSHWLRPTCKHRHGSFCQESSNYCAPLSLSSPQLYKCNFCKDGCMPIDYGHTTESYSQRYDMHLRVVPLLQQSFAGLWRWRLLPSCPPSCPGSSPPSSPSTTCSSGSSPPPAPRCWGSSRGGWWRSPASTWSRPPWRRRLRPREEPQCFARWAALPGSWHNPHRAEASQISVPGFGGKSHILKLQRSSNWVSKPLLLSSGISVGHGFGHWLMVSCYLSQTNDPWHGVRQWCRVCDAN